MNKQTIGKFVMPFAYSMAGVVLVFWLTWIAIKSILSTGYEALELFLGGD